MVLRLEGSWSLLVGKRFLCLSEEEDRTWDASLISEWPWKSGRIRAVSHTDISKQDLKVTGNFQRDSLNRACEWGSWCGCVYSFVHMLLSGQEETVSWPTRLETCTPAQVPDVLVLMPQIISN